MTAILLSAATPALAQDAYAGAAPAAATQSAPLSTAQLEQLVAPIALFPDDLMSQMLMASTYPLEVVQAARWSKENPNVTGTALQDAMAKQRWDPSVKALTAVPQSLQMMNDKIDWTQQLGDAFLGQQSDVLAAVQTLRARAEAAGNLKTTPQQTVARTAQPGPGGSAQPVITIAPTDSRMTYVPIYDPATVFGAWPYPDYLPSAWYPPGYVATGALAFGAGIATGAAIWGGVDWWRGNVFVNANRFNAFNRTHIANNVWNHNPAHRGAVPYRDRAVADRFGDRNRAAARDAARNRTNAGQRDLARPGGNNAVRNAATGRDRGAKAGTQARGRPQARSNRTAVNRSGAAQRQVNRPRTAARPAGVNRPMGMRPAGLNRPAGGMRRGGGLRRR
jgi:hypothetical protein